MKKNSIILQAAAILLTSCAQQENPVGTISQNDSSGYINEVEVIVPAFTDADGVKSAVTADGKFYFQADDKLGFWPGSGAYDPSRGAQQTIFYVAQDNSSSFLSNGWGLLPNKTYYSYYPYDATATASKVTISYDDQTQSANGSTSHLGKYDYMHAATTSGSQNASINYSHLGCVAKFTLTIIGNTASSFRNFKLQSVENILVSSVDYNPSEETPGLNKTQTNTMSVALDGISPSGNTLTIYAMMSPVAWKGKTINATLTDSNGGEYKGIINPTADQTAGKMFTYTLSVTGGDFEPATKELGGHTYTNLSAGGYSNCYIVPAEGYYCFNVTKKGNGEQKIDKSQLGNVEEAYDPSGTITDSIDKQAGFYSDGYAYFHATANTGNAVIIARYADGQPFLWSWHIWCAGAKPGTAELGTYTLMDTNLGAFTGHPEGCYYQWGRKDPFPNSSALSGYNCKNSDNETGTIAYSIENPMTFIQRPNDSGHWIYNNNDHSLWGGSEGTEKTMYDPCPAGYKVPDEGIWAYAKNVSGWPIAGWYNYGLEHSNNGQARYWTTAFTKSGEPVYGETIAKVIQYSTVEGEDQWNPGYSHAFTACPIRCQKMPVPAPSVVTNSNEGFGSTPSPSQW